jgi:ADP-ribose pyrophosphatase YjhB (NUDIX family)
LLRFPASKMMAAHTAAPVERIEALFENETGYATPKVDVRGAVFDDRDRLLLVRELADGGRWTLPGGSADVNPTAAENVVIEVREESGFDVRVRKVAAIWDRTRQGHANAVFSCCKLFYICYIVGGAAATGPETSEVGWFCEEECRMNFRSAAFCRTSSGACSCMREIPYCQPSSTEGPFRVVNRRPAKSATEGSFSRSPPETRRSLFNQIATCNAAKPGVM